MSEYEKQQERELVFALDIGTRSIIGVVGHVREDRFHVLAIAAQEHDKRAMMDGQIEDIEQVARVARSVTQRLEAKLDRRLTRVCVAAAGRALRMERGVFRLELPSAMQIDEEIIGRLEAGAVSEAEALLDQDKEEERRFFLVGYTVAQYQLDHYPMNTLKGHSGRELEAEVVATFLPSGVVESLYATMRLAGLEVASLTLEPIAALNAAIPAELRLLNLVLADIGAGTSDIAVCREGSVVGYTMATMAGDEITEALMRAYLVDFKTAEQLKAKMADEDAVEFTDILGLSQLVCAQELRGAAVAASRRLAEEIAARILAVNGAAPSALFLAGGGSKLAGFGALMAECLGIDARRVAVAGNHFHLTLTSEDCELNNPEYATPLGIAASAGLGLVSDSYLVTLNGLNAKLFRSGSLTALDILMMNGYTYADLIGRTGHSLALTVNGERRVFRGSPATPSQLRINGRDARPTAVVHAGDSIVFTPAGHGISAEKTLGGLLGKDFLGRALVNGNETPLDTSLRTGDEILYSEGGRSRTPSAPVHLAEGGHTAARGPVVIQLNEVPVVLPPKEDGAPQYLMDTLQLSGLDFDRLERPVVLEVNGQPGRFTQELKENDVVSIRYAE